MGVVELSSGFEGSSSAVDWSSLITSSFFSPSSFPSSSSSLSLLSLLFLFSFPALPHPHRVLGSKLARVGASVVGVASCLVASSSGGVTTKETGSLGSRGISSADSETA